MFGYIKTDYPNLIVKDTILYRSMYCGLCKSLKKSCGNKARFCLNYDLTFLSVLLHNYLNNDITIEKQRCVIHWFRKQPIALVDDLTKRIASLNVILAYHKLNDDVADEKKGGIKRSFFKSSYKKARKNEPELDRIVIDSYKKLVELEKSNCDSVDIVSDPFGNMMRNIVGVLVGDGNHEVILNLAYGLGKWIYLIDALDDFDKDKKSGAYNVFNTIYNLVESKKEFIDKNRRDLEVIFGSVLSDIIDNARLLKYNFNHDLIDNVLFKGLNVQTKKIMENCKCKNTTKF